MKKYKNKLIIVILLILTIIMITPNSYAGLQANKGGKSLNNTTASAFYGLIQGMESSTGTLAVSPDGTNGNGIDCHMILNTEWRNSSNASSK